MVLKIILFVVLIIVGVFLMWMAVFGKKQDVNDFASVPSDFAELFLLLFYKLLPTFLRRIFLFVLGVFLVAGVFLLLFY
jgi:hypothetical protein